MNNFVEDNGQASEQGQLEDIHLWDYIGVVIRRLRLAVTVFLAVVLLVFAYTWTRTARYRATARILAERGQVDFTNLKDSYDFAVAGISQREFVETQAKLITSRPVIESAFTKMDLAFDPGFAQAKDPIGSLTAVIQVQPVRNSQLIDVSVERTNPQQAASMVNAVIDCFIAESRKRRAGISEDGLLEMRKKAEGLRIKLDEASQKLQGFMVANNTVSFEKVQNIVADRLRDFNSSLSQAQPKRMAIEAKVTAADEALKGGQTSDSLPDVLDSSVIKEMKLELARLGQKYSEMLQRLGENHPQLQGVKTQMDAMETKLGMESSAIVASLKTQYQQAVSEETLLREAVKQQEQEMMKFNQLSIEYDMLKQSKDSIESTYKTIIRRIEEVDINRMGGQGDNIFVIARAEVPTTKSWPHKAKNMAVGIMLGAILAVGLCFFLDYMDTTINDAMDVTRLLGTTVMGVIPAESGAGKSGKELDLLSNTETHGQFAEAFRMIRTALTFKTPGTAIKSLLVTSTFPSEGKTLIAVNLAIAEAQAGRRTLLVDGDLRKPRIHNIFDLPQDSGLSSLLQIGTQAKLDDVAAKVGVDNLFVVPSGPIPMNPGELLDSERFSALVREMESKFEVVIIDSPPGISVIDPIVIGRRVGGMALVVRSNSTQKNAARWFVERVHEAGVHLLGAVINDVVAKRTGYGYYYSSAPFAPYRYSQDQTEKRKGLADRVSGFLSGRR